MGSVYRYFPDKEAIVEALATLYWCEFADLVAASAELDERSRMPDPAAGVLEALAAAFRGRPGFLALWYGGLRPERIRDATRPTREAIAASVERILAVHWPRPIGPRSCRRPLGMVVVAGDGLLREAFRTSRRGDDQLLAESRWRL